MNILEILEVGVKWDATSGARPERDVARASSIFAGKFHTEPVLIVMNRYVEKALVRYYMAAEYNNQVLKPYLDKRVMPPRWFDMKMLVLPVEFLLVVGDLGNDVWVIFKDQMVVLKDVLM